MSLLDCGCGVGSITLDLAERVLDVAGGSGAVTRQAAHAVGAAGKVVELDISPSRLAVAASLDGQEDGRCFGGRHDSGRSAFCATGPGCAPRS